MEIWKTLKGYEGDYEVSNMGNVRSVDKVFTCYSLRGNGIHERTRYGRVLQPSIQNNGYCVVWLSRNGKVKAHTVHRLIATTFIENPNNYYCVNHKNGNKTDNRVENLEWLNRSTHQSIHNTENKKKLTYQYTLDNTLVKEWKSVKEALTILFQLKKHEQLVRK